MERTWTVRRRNGRAETFRSVLTDAEAVEVLRDEVARRGVGAGSFARSLVSFASRRKLSEKQLAWAHKIAGEMIERRAATTIAVPAKTTTDGPRPRGCDEFDYPAPVAARATVGRIEF